jgi:hypothetical protein
VLIGKIVRLQVQRPSLKVGEPSRRRYDPAPIRSVARLDLSPGGVVGWDDAGERLLAVHHGDHPLSKNRHGDNGVSIGFRSHYDAMRERFGDHVRETAWRGRTSWSRRVILALVVVAGFRLSDLERELPGVAT